MFHIVANLARACGFMLTVAAGGLVGGMVAGFIPLVIHEATAPQRAPDPAFVKNWVHGGWFVGASLFGMSGVVHYWRKWRTVPSAQSDDQQEPDEGDVDETPMRPVRSLPAKMALCAFGGALLGLFVGGSLLLVWFSLTYSPFSPDEWAESLSLERRRVGEPGPRSVVTTDHPVALYLFSGPIVLGALVGLVAAMFPQMKVTVEDRGG